MEIEVFAVCDAATDSAGKLNVLGVFDSIITMSVPIVHPQCAVALRIRFLRIEAGNHKIRVNIVDADGKPVVPPLEADINVAFRGQEPSLAANMIMNLQRLHLNGAGEYSVDAAIDGRHERSIPLTVRVRPTAPSPSPSLPS